MVRDDDLITGRDFLRFSNDLRASARASGLRVFGSVGETVKVITDADCLNAGSYTLRPDEAVAIVRPATATAHDPDEEPDSGDEYVTFAPAATIASWTLNLPENPEDGSTVTLLATRR